MGRNAGFGRPPAHERLRLWWNATSRASRNNALLALAVGAVVVALLIAATSRDATRAKPQAVDAGPTFATLNPLSTVVVGDLRTAGAPGSPAELSGASTSSSTSTTTATTVVVTPPSVPVASPRTTTTTVAAEPAPATTVPTSEVIFTDAPPVTAAPVDTTVPTTTAPPTTIPSPTTTTTTTGIPLPLVLPPLLGPG